MLYRFCHLYGLVIDFSSTPMSSHPAHPPSLMDNCSFFFSIVHSVNDIREDSVDAEMKKWSAGVSVFCRDVRSVRSLRALLLRCGTTKSDLHLTPLLTVSKLPSLAFCVIS